MSDLRDLYQEVILDHSKAPRNFGVLKGATHSAEGYNPLCGDRLELYLVLEGDKVTDAGFKGDGCAISTASASLMTEILKGMTRADAEAMFAAMHTVLTGEGEVPEGVDIGKLAVFEGVRAYPMRVKCATLAWHTMRNAIQEKAEEVATTE